MIDIEYFKKKLLSERDIVREEISSLGTIAVSKENWNIQGEMLADSAEEMAIADKFEIEETKDAILDQLENRLLDIERALNKIETGVYGICEVSGERIEEARLEANPAARTTIAHKGDILEL